MSENNQEFQNLSFELKISQTYEGAVAGFSYMQLDLFLKSPDHNLEINKSLIYVLKSLQSKLVEHEKKIGEG